MKKRLVIFFQLSPVLISALLIAAHFFRTNNMFLAIVSLLMPVCLLVRHPLSARIVQLSLTIAALEWLRTTYMLVLFRSEMGWPWARLVIILGAVVCFTFASALVFLSKRLKERYKL